MIPKIKPLTAIELDKWKRRLEAERVKDINAYWDSKKINLNRKPRKDK